jgi:hypothetical protein
MDELERALRLGVSLELRPQPEFDRLDVVIGLGLDRLDLTRILFREIPYQPGKFGQSALRERLELLDRALGGERLEPFELDARAVADERLFAEVPAQGIGAA